MLQKSTLPSKLFAALSLLAGLLMIVSPVLGQQGGAGGANNNYLPMIKALSPIRSSGSDWAMAGANPARTSWTEEEIQGSLKPLWFKTFDAYISQKVQVIAANNLLYISTSGGLYALDASNGSEKWVYPTEMPLGHSPAVVNGVAYVGGFDHKLHAINALTGKGLWTFTAGAGFDTSPLVVDGKVYLGNRDGSFYAIHARGPNQGQLAWKFQTQGPIHFSAAYADGVVYFASDDSHAYALNAADGSLVWKSAKLPGSGFHSWWPVVYQGWVVFAGSSNYRSAVNEPWIGPLQDRERDDVYPHNQNDSAGTMVGPVGTAPGPWAPGTVTIDASRPNTTANGRTTPITEYLEQKPWRRTVFVLDRASGREYTSDFDKDGKPEYAPFLWQGTHSGGNRYPPVVGKDGVLYMPNNYKSDPHIPDGHITGWQPGSPYISIISKINNAIDEPLVASAGGSMIYWNQCCDRAAGAIDISRPVDAPNREWTYFNYDLDDLLPGYNEKVWPAYPAPWGGIFGGRPGVYGYHGDVNPPVPYNGRVYMHRSNAILAFAPDTGSPAQLPPAAIQSAPAWNGPGLSDAELKSRLAAEVQKMLDAGHLRPGYVNSGLFDQVGTAACGDSLTDYWHTPGDTLLVLLQALPFLPAEMQPRVKTYLQNEFQNYPPYKYNHIGWKDGAPREVFDMPPEIAARLPNFPAQDTKFNFVGWKIAPQQFYAMWKYAQVFPGDAKAIFDAARGRLNAPPADSYLADMPHVHNAFITGYWGYLELQKLAGYPEDPQVRSQLNRLLSLRAANFSDYTPESYFTDKNLRYCRILNVARNFMYITPELADYLQANALSKVHAAIADYEQVAPYWFVSQFEGAFGEGVITPLYDYHALFQAKALILDEPRSQLEKYLDVPAVAVGDLFYIHNLTIVLQATGY